MSNEWIPARSVVGVNADGSLIAVDSWGGKQKGPTLTDKEREAIERAEARLRTAYVPDDETADTLRSLLERLR
jgi:hypothetical protein